jgi:glycosyltransferase involved in cell wall biosynthesis
MVDLISSNDVDINDNPMVSIIVPTYNRPIFLFEAINSIAAQTYNNYEIIVINDGGVDVIDIINKFQGLPIRYILHQKNRGLPATRNTGIRLARGKYIAYLDDDDIYYPDHLMTLVNFLENSEFKVAYTSVLKRFQEKKGDFYETVKKEMKITYDYDPDRLLYSDYLLVHSIMHEKTCLDHVGLFDETLRLSEDWDLWIRLSRKYKFYHINKITCEYTRRSDLSHLSYKIVDAHKTKLKIFMKYIKYSIKKPIVMKEQKIQAVKALKKIIEHDYHIYYIILKKIKNIFKR